MRRFPRILLTAATALSLLLCLASAALWIRSYRTLDAVTHTSAHLRRAVSGGGGVFLESLTLVVEHANWRDPSVPPTTTSHPYTAWPLAAGGADPTQPWAHVAMPYEDRRTLLKVAWGPDLHRALPQFTRIAQPRQRVFDNTNGSRFTYILVGPRIYLPYWLPTALFAIAPIVSARRLLRLVEHRRRVRRHLCPTCNYDLRATPNRCPECGCSAPAESVPVR